MAQCHKRAFVTPSSQGDSSTQTAPELASSCTGRERSVPSPAKARTERRFHGRCPSLIRQQRKYIQGDQSKGVSQQELAKRLELRR